jgi:energy-converting hydrogenase Eha subunit C
MRLHWINWIAAIGCLLSAIAFTVASKPIDKIAIFVLLGIANVGFIFLRSSASQKN